MQMVCHVFPPLSTIKLIIHLAVTVAQDSLGNPYRCTYGTLILLGCKVTRAIITYAPAQRAYSIVLQRM